MIPVLWARLLRHKLLRLGWPRNTAIMPHRGWLSTRINKRIGHQSRPNRNRVRWQAIGRGSL